MNAEQTRPLAKERKELKLSFSFDSHKLLNFARVASVAVAFADGLNLHPGFEGNNNGLAIGATALFALLTLPLIKSEQTAHFEQPPVDFDPKTMRDKEVIDWLQQGDKNMTKDNVIELPLPDEVQQL